MNWYENKENKEEFERAARNLKTAFSGRGVVGLAEILRHSCILAPIESEAGRVIHNDRIALIEVLVGPGNMDGLMDKLCDLIVSMQIDSKVPPGESPQEKRREDYELSQK